MLSDKAIQALRPDPERPGTKHHDRDGLYLWVARSGSKTWRKDYRWQGARRTFTFGAYPAVRLADARKQALEQRLARLEQLVLLIAQQVGVPPEAIAQLVAPAALPPT